MPRQFGPFMVPSTSSVQHQKKVKKETNEREERLEAWKREKAERTERLRQSQKKTQQQHASPLPPPRAPPPSSVAPGERAHRVGEAAAAAKLLEDELEDEVDYEEEDVTDRVTSSASLPNLNNSGSKRGSPSSSAVKRRSKEEGDLQVSPKCKVGRSRTVCAIQ